MGLGTTAGHTLITGGTFGLTIAGTGVLNLQTGTSLYSGGTTIGTATVVVGNDSANAAEVPLSLGTGTITLNSGGKLWAQPGNSTTTYNFTQNFVFNGGTFQGEDGVQRLATSGATINVQAGGGTIDATWNGKDVYLDGIISGSGALNAGARHFGRLESQYSFHQQR